MNVGIIRLSAASHNYRRIETQILSDLGLAPVAFFEGLNAQEYSAIDDAENCVQINARIDQEGPGHFINRCVEYSASYEPAIDRFVVIGDINDYQLRRDGRMTISAFAKKRSVILSGALPFQGPVTRSDLLRLFGSAAYSHRTGLVVFDRDGWNRAGGFPEDTGPWGAELHFALAVVAAGGEAILAPPLLQMKQRHAGDSGRLASGMIALAEYGTSTDRIQGSLQMLRSNVRARHITKSLRDSTFQFRAARETLRSRSFFKAGG